MYYSWEKRIHPQIGLYSVQLPGRESRIMEKPYSTIKDVIPCLLQDIEGLMEKPCMLFGHSMGAKVAFELERALEKEQKESLHLIISGSRAPHVPEPRPICHLTDKEFLKELNRFDGTPLELLKNQELMSIFMPLLRADFTMDETYISDKKEELCCPISAFCGNQDLEANEEEMKQWSEYTKYFQLKVFEGRHFFVKTNEKQVIDSINHLATELIN